MHRRGTTLGMVLLLLTAGLTLVLTSASLGVFNLRYTTELDDRDHARNLAESAIYQAIALINTNASYGKGNETPPAVTCADLPGARGRLTFDPSQASSWGCRRSSNNLDQPASAAGDGQPVPANGVHLVGQGHCGEVTLQMELVYYRPPYAKAVAATGNVTMQSVELSGMAPGEAFDPTDYAAKLDDTSVYAGKPGAQSVRLTGNCQIHGSVGSVGGINISAPAKVTGEVRPGAAPEVVPKIDVAAVVFEISRLPSLVPVGGPIDGFAFSDGAVTLSEVQLKGGVLAVRGDLTVTGPISGYGAVIVDGNLKVGAGSGLSSDFAALAATGDIDLVATGPASNFFQGMVYSRGNLTAKKITVIGSMIANSDDPDAGRMQLEDMTLIHTRSALQGGIAPPQKWYLGDGVPKGLPADDTAVVLLAARIKPGSLTEFEYFGKGYYSADDAKTFADVMDTIFYEADFHGNEAELDLQMEKFFDNNAEDNGSLWNEGEDKGDPRGLVQKLKQSLTSGGGTLGVLNFDLNKLLTPQEGSRVVLFRQVTD